MGESNDIIFAGGNNSLTNTDNLGSIDISA